jgi:membrane-bound serine protease (ClpP class)
MKTPSNAICQHLAHGPMGASGWVVSLLGLVALVLSSPLAPRVVAQDAPADPPYVVIIPITGTIEPGLGHFLDRAIGEAEDANATAIILDINTPGGRLDTVLEMRDRILDTGIPVIAYVNREAFSAGALITIASDEIWMTPGAVFGAATPIDGATGASASEKTISAVRSTFRSTAEQQGRDPVIAEAMVDPVVAIDGLDTSTSLLTLSTTQALEHGYADGVANDRATLLTETGFADATSEVASMTLWERSVRWITDPIVASLLILIGMALIVVDGLVGGFGVVAAAGLGCLGLFFWGHHLAGLAGWEDLLLIVIGLVLILLEAFVIPGFGVTGILGGVALAGGLVLAMTRRDIGDEGFGAEVGDVLATVLATLAGTVVVIVIITVMLPRLAPSVARPARGVQRMTLSATVAQGGNNPSRPGYFTRLLGGGETVGRDTGGHTAITRDANSTSDTPRD